MSVGWMILVESFHQLIYELIMIIVSYGSGPVSSWLFIYSFFLPKQKFLTHKYMSLKMSLNIFVSLPYISSYLNQTQNCIQIIGRPHIDHHVLCAKRCLIDSYNTFKSFWMIGKGHSAKYTYNICLFLYLFMENMSSCSAATFQAVCKNISQCVICFLFDEGRIQEL